MYEGPSLAYNFMISAILFVCVFVGITAIYNSDGFVESSRGYYASVQNREIQKTERQRIKSEAFSENLEMVTLGMIIVAAIVGIGGGLLWFLNKQADRNHEMARESMWRLEDNVRRQQYQQLPYSDNYTSPPQYRVHEQPQQSSTGTAIVTKDFLQRVDQSVDYNLYDIDGNGNYIVTNLRTNEQKRISVAQ